MLRALQALLLAFLFLFGASSASASAQTTVTYFHNDISGSPMIATDAAGNVVWKEGYRPYGEKTRNEVPSRTDTNKIGYAGSPFDASTGLSYMGARYYDPVIGRFMGIDPVGFQEDNIHSFNRYAYANNNPYRYIDRDGRQSTDILYNVWNRAFSNSAGPNANGAAGFEVGKQGLVQGYFDGLSLSASVGMSVSPFGFGLAKGASRVTSEIGPALGWTKNGANDLASRLTTEVAAKEALNVSTVKKLAQDGFTKSQFESLAQKLQSSAANSLKEHNQLLQNRIDHLKDVINLWSK
jgi:RHS repeat-associated protein